MFRIRTKIWALSILVGLGAALSIVGSIFQEKEQPSTFEKAAEGLALDLNQQEALLSIFYLLGYLKAEKIWTDLVSFDEPDHATQIFKSIFPNLRKAGALEGEYAKFNPKLLRKTLFTPYNPNNVPYVQAWLLYVAQNAYSRQAGQERYEVACSFLKETHYRELLQCYTTLGLIKEIAPKCLQYDEIWIAGATREGLLRRILYTNNLLNQIKKSFTGAIKALAGERPLWAEADGLTPRSQKLKQLAIAPLFQYGLENPQAIKNKKVEEGKAYLLYLAKKNGTALHTHQPFIKYYSVRACPPGFFPGKTYPNYAHPREKRLTESLMSADLLARFLVRKASVVDTKCQYNKRPSTWSTVFDATQSLIERFLENDTSNQKLIRVLLISNQPYVNRQTMSAQRAANKAMASSNMDKKGHELIIEGVGEAIQDLYLSTLHSEMSALITEKYQKASQSHPKVKRYPLKKLLYQTRPPEKLKTDLPPIPIPETTLMERVGNWLERFTAWSRRNNSTPEEKN